MKKSSFIACRESKVAESTSESILPGFLIGSWQAIFSRFSLAQKGAALAILPVVVQLILLCGIFITKNQADTTTLIKGNARVAAETAGEVVFYHIAVIGRFNQAIEQSMVPEADIKTDMEKLQFWANRLRELKTESPQKIKIMDEILEKTIALVSLTNNASAGNIPTNSEALMPEIQQQEKVLDNLLLRFIQEETPSPEKKHTSTRLQPIDQLSLIINPGSFLKLSIALTGFNVGCVLLMGLFFNRDIIKRLSGLHDNSFRLARGQSLLPILPGNDEIAQLDRAFHMMADSLAAASARQHALIENARDVLCSLDPQRRFRTVNSAAAIVLGYPPAKLSGIRVEEIIAPEDRQVVVERLAALLSGTAQSPFELRALRPDGTIMHTLWSANYSSADNSIFCVVHDINERKAAEKAKKDVMQMVSHDLRSPLSAIRIVYTMFEEVRFGQLDSNGKKRLAAAVSNTESMLKLINDLLDFEKMEAGMLGIDKTEVELIPVIQQSIQSVQPLANKKGINISLDCPAISICADPHRIAQIMINLLSNAVKFSPDGGEVAVSACRKGEFLQISVSDSGRGIPSEHIKSVFERFRQSRATDAKVYGGSGLGLAICKALVELHGGTICVESSSGQGSRFYFSLPYQDSL